jgi:hypothetical protein
MPDAWVLTGSVVGIQFEVVTMYTGTLISDLMKTVERVSNLAEQQINEELHEIFTMQVPFEDGNRVYQGAA